MDVMNVMKVKKHKKEASIDSVLIENEGYFKFKRLLDIVGAILGLLALTPVFLLVALLIKMEEPAGPIFFKQLRVGKDKTPFYMFKFRSMCVDAEAKLEELLESSDVKGAMFKMKEDPRITRIGRFIRKTSIDELPQLWNVLRGEMSLVGPRPPLPREVEQYTTYDEQRLRIIPGCTGLWQVSGRNNLDFEEMVELDIYYIKNISLSQDAKIVLKTFAVLLGDDGAY